MIVQLHASVFWPIARILNARIFYRRDRGELFYVGATEVHSWWPE